jgi:4-alpha-glucanotransferase
VYVSGPYQEHYAVFCLESQRRRVILVGEDLGIVPPSVRPAMERHQVDRLFVAQCQFHPQPNGPAPSVPDNAVASMNTHDLAPYAAFCRNLDLNDRLSLGLIDAPRFAQHAADRQVMRDALLRFFAQDSAGQPQRRKGWRHVVQRLRSFSPFPQTDWSKEQELAILQRWLIALGASPARVVLVNLEDLWQCPDAQNVPGTWKERPNWSRRATHALEEFACLPAVVDTLRQLNDSRRQRQLPFETVASDSRRQAG